MDSALKSYRAPLRISLAGGGTDHAHHYSRFGGLTVGFTINRGLEVMPVSAARRDLLPDGWITLKPDDPLVRAARIYLGVPREAEFASRTDVSGVGTGLATSAAFLLAFQAAVAQKIGKPEDAAEKTHHIESVLVGRFSGKQDPYLVAHGGFQALHISRSGSVMTEPLAVSDSMHRFISDRVLLFHSGVDRAPDFMKSRQRLLPSSTKDDATMTRVQAIAHEMLRVVEEGLYDQIAPLVAEHWDMKCARTPYVAPARVLEYIDLAKSLGADGYKLIGAGGGGYLLLLAPLERIRDLRCGMAAVGAHELSFDLDMQGVSESNGQSVQHRRRPARGA